MTEGSVQLENLHFEFNNAVKRFKATAPEIFTPDT